MATNTVTHTTDAHVSGGSAVQGEAGVVVQAREESPTIVAAAGNFAVSNKGVAIGAAIPTNTVTRHLSAYVGDEDEADFDAGADGASLTSANGAVTVAATRQSSLVLAIGVSGVGAESFSLGGSVVETNIKSSTVDAHVWGGTLDGNQGVAIQAEDTKATNVAGAGNLDLSFLFQSSGSQNGNNGNVQQQPLVEDAVDEAEDDLQNDDNISEAEDKIDENLSDQEELDSQEQAANGNMVWNPLLEEYQVNSDPFQGPVDVVSDASSDPNPASQELSASVSVSVGLALANNLASRDNQPTVLAFASDAVLTSETGTIEVTADQTILFVTVAGSGSLSNNTVNVDGTEATTVFRPITRAYIDATGGTPSMVTAEGNVIVAADSIVHAVTIAGNIAFNKSGSSVALTFATMAHEKGTTEAYIDNADVTANGNADDSTVTTGSQGQATTNDQFRGVSVAANSRQVFTTVAAGIEVAGKFNVAASVSINLVGSDDSLTTRAYVGEGATINEANSAANDKQSLNIFAHSDTIVQGGGGAFGVSTGKNLGVGASADGGNITKTTEAYLSASVANVKNVVSVQAYSEEDLLSFAGTLELSSQSSELAGAFSMYVFDVTTNAYIGSSSGNGSTKFVKADGSVLVAANNETTINYIVGAVEVTEGKASVGGAVVVNVLTGHTNAYISGDAVVTALADVSTDTIAAAAGGYDIAYDDVPDDGSQVGPPGSVPTATGGDGEVSADDPVWTKTREATGKYADIRGVAVTSNVSETLKGGVAAVGIGQSVAVDIGGFVPISTRHTRAYIAGNVNQSLAEAGNENQDVVVTASTDYHNLTLVIPIASASFGMGMAATAAGAGWVSANLTTEAFIDDNARVLAGGDVLVVAVASEHIVRAVFGGASTAGKTSVSVDLNLAGLFLTTRTDASIGQNAIVVGGGNVLVSAADNTIATGVAGGAAAAFSPVGGGLGAGVVYTHIGKSTSAFIDENARVDAGGNGGEISVINGEIDAGNNSFASETITGLAVEAQSSEKLTNLGVSLDGGANAGVAGGVTYTNVDSDTSATIAASALINQNDTVSMSGSQSVNVSATNQVSVLDAGGALAAGAGVFRVVWTWASSAIRRPPRSRPAPRFMRTKMSPFTPCPSRT